jgi:hypothetical protein
MRHRMYSCTHFLHVILHLTAAYRTVCVGGLFEKPYGLRRSHVLFSFARFFAPGARLWLSAMSGAMVSEGLVAWPPRTWALALRIVRSGRIWPMINRKQTEQTPSSPAQAHASWHSGPGAATAIRAARMMRRFIRSDTMTNRIHRTRYRYLDT